VVLPVLKILLLDKLLRARDGDTDRLKKHLRWMHLYGKWSMRIPAMADTGSGDGGHHRSVATQAG